MTSNAVSYEGYRDLNDPDHIRITGAYPSCVEYNKPTSCQGHDFCEHEYRPIEPVTAEETNPLPAPVEKQHQNAYINEKFKQRHVGAKNRLIIDGKIRVVNKEEKRGVEIAMPSNEALEDWKVQSIQFGLHLKQLKDQQQKKRRGAQEENEGGNSPASQHKSPSTVKKSQTNNDFSQAALASERQKSSVFPKINIEQHLRPMTKRVPELVYNPLVQGTAVLQMGMYAHLNRPPIEKKQSQNMAKYAGQVTKKLSQSNDNLALGQQNFQGITPQSAAKPPAQNFEDAEKSSSKSTQSVVIDAKNRRREPNQKPWNQNTEQTDLALAYLKQNQVRRFDCHSLDSKTNGVQRQNSAWFHSQNTNTSNQKADQDEDSDPEDKQIQDMIPQSIRILLKKVSKEYHDQRRKQLQEKAASSAGKLQSYADRRSAPKYNCDLRQIFQDEMKKMDNGVASLQLSEKKWDDIIKVQDDWNRVEALANDALKQAYSGLNPKFSMDRRTFQKRHISNTAHSSQRVKYVEQLGTTKRIQNLREEMGILAYMKRNGLENQSHKGDSNAMIDDFIEETLIHPCLVPRPEVIKTESDDHLQFAALIPPKVLAKAISPLNGGKSTNQSELEDHFDPSQSRHTESGQQKLSESPTIVQVDTLQIVQQQSIIKLPSSTMVSSCNRSQMSQQMHRTGGTESTTSRGVTSEMKSPSVATSPRKTSPDLANGIAPAPYGEQKNTYLSSDFWFHKGVVLNQKSQNESAVQCYRQALKIDEKHLPSIFNLACNLEKLKRYEEAKKWFEHAIKVQPKWSDALYGLTLVCIRLDLAVEAIKYSKAALAIDGDNAAPHIKYAIALAYRANFDWEKANDAYAPIMKNTTSILEYQELINKKNQLLMESNLNGDLGGTQVEVDLYSHFMEEGLGRPHQFNVDLFPYYDIYEGWQHDKINHVVNLLKKIRFFNRFDDDALKMMLTKVTLKRLKKNSVLFFRDAEAAIIVSGNLHLLSHEEDLACPYIAATYNPGDVIGIDNDNGWYGGKHSWLCAWDDVDVFLISDAYCMYMWDNMKRFHSNLVADMLDRTPQLTELSEQTIFTIAHDIAKFKEYRDGEVIVNQDQNSVYNLLFQQQERAAIMRLTEECAETEQLKRKFQSDLNPKIGRVWANREAKKEFHEHRIEHKLEQNRQQLLKLVNMKAHEMEYARMNQAPPLIGAQLQQDITKMKQINSLYEGEANRAKEIIRTSIQKLEQYKSDREQLKPESDGIYIIVKGEGKVVNPYDDQKLIKLQKGDYFGASKFLNEQRYTYFGDTIACAPQAPSTSDKDKKGQQNALNKTDTFDSGRLEKKKTVIQTGKSLSQTKDPSQTQQNPDNQVVTTCMFLSKELLYLIPYYDLQRLRDLNLTDKKVIGLRNKCFKDYREAIRKLKKSFK